MTRSEMPGGEELPFDEAPRGDGAADGLGRLRARVDAATAAALFDQALDLAREGHLGQARDRLRALCLLDPHDGGAHLLLAKVHAAGGRFGEAQAALDAAAACGVVVPQELRERVAEGRRAELDVDRGERMAARVQSELAVLREEARRLRSDNARLQQRARLAEGRARLWTTTTTVVATVGALLLAATLLRAPATAEAPEAAVEAPEAAPLPPERAPRASRPATYVVRPGDTLSRISMEVYGTSSRWHDLLEANEATLNGRTDLKVGAELVIPE